MSRPYKNTPLQAAYDRKHEQLRLEVWRRETDAIIKRNLRELEEQLKPRIRVKAISVRT